VDWGTGITVLATAIVAVSGYVITYQNSLLLSQRKERLDRIDRQLRELYGPLLALHLTSNEAVKEFRRSYRPTRAPYWSKGDPPTEMEAEAWRLWITEVAMPINERMVQVIQEHADLLEEPEIPKPFTKLSAHTAGYKFLLKAWEAGDYSRNTPLTPFPQDLAPYVRARYVRLQKTQAEIMGAIYEGQSPWRRFFNRGEQ
jgi:hypothetical protein